MDSRVTLLHFLNDIGIGDMGMRFFYDCRVCGKKLEFYEREVGWCLDCETKPKEEQMADEAGLDADIESLWGETEEVANQDWRVGVWPDSVVQAAEHGQNDYGHYVNLEILLSGREDAPAKQYVHKERVNIPTSADKDNQWYELRKSFLLQWLHTFGIIKPDVQTYPVINNDEQAVRLAGLFRPGQIGLRPIEIHVPKRKDGKSYRQARPKGRVQA